jgi:hypothetical protein
VRQCWVEIEADKTKVVPRFAPGVVDNDESTAWSDWVRDKIVGQVVIGTHEIKGEFGLWKKLRPVINWEGGVDASEYTEEVAFI